MAENLKAPFPAFGGKSKIADVVWARLGNPRNYIEPFAFSAAMLLKREEPGPIETINDLNCFVSNFWRAVKTDPERVAHYADWPVNETDLHARHKWLVRSNEAKARLQKVRDDPEFFDAKIAGWWCWGGCCWIGSGWCETQKLPHISQGQGVNSLTQKLPHISQGQGVNSLTQKLPHMDGGARGGVIMSGEIGDKCDWEGRGSGAGHPRGIHGALPMLGGDGLSGRGVHSPTMGHEKRPCFPDGATGGRGVHEPLKEIGRPAITDAFTRGRGVNSNDAAGTCQRRREWLIDWMMRLSDRLRPVRVCCGHWSRGCDSPSTMTRLGLTGVFLDPPYRMTIDGKRGANRAKHIYANDRHQDVNALCDEVQEWCLKWGGDKEVRIVLCGLEGEYPKVEAAGWELVAWRSNGGYGNRNGDNLNAERERLWISPHCLKPVPDQGSMFS